MKYRILFHSHVFVHKAHAVFFRLSEPRKVLIMADYPLIGMQFFRGPCFSRSAVHRQIAGDFETFAPVFLALVRLAGQDHAGSRGDREQEFRLTWSKTEASLIVEDRGTSLVSSFPVEFRHTYSHAFSMFRIPAQGNDGVLRPTAVGQNHRECGLSGHDIRLDSHIGFHPVEHEPCIVWAGPVKLPVANDDLIARQHYGDDCSHVRTGLSPPSRISTVSSTPSSGFRRCSSPYRRDSSLWIRRRVPFPRWSSFSSGVSVFFGPFSFIPFPYSGGFPWIL